MRYAEQHSQLADVYYARGYARTKSYEANASRTASIRPLDAALDDFWNCKEKCKEVDPLNSKAHAAIEKINTSRRQRRSELLVDVFGPVTIFCFSVLVFLFAQLAFMNKLLQQIDATAYGSLTFASLLFMVAAVYLPQLLKLKLPGIELEKTSIDRVSARSIGIGRSGSLITRRSEPLKN
jgi:hypothetical protein